MANPQKENGYVPVANEIFDFLCSFRVPGEVRQIFDAILRKTYGYNKSEDKIANTQIIELTGLTKGNVSRGLSKLITHRLVIKADNFSKDGKTLGINKDYDKWIPFVIKRDNKRKLSKRITKVIKSDNKKLSEVRDTKDNIHSKDILRDKSRGVEKKKKAEEMKKIKKLDSDPQNLEEYISLMRASPQKHIQVIGEYADQIRPEFETVGQWRVFTKRNLRVATELSVYSDDQIAKAFDKLKKNIKSDKNPKGYITRWTLETLLSYVIH